MLGKGKGKEGKGESNEDEKDKDQDKKCKATAKATEYFAGYCLFFIVGRHMKKDCWWNESAKSGKDTASLETPITPFASTTTEPPITGMFLQSDEGGEVPADPAQWMYSVTKQESVPNANDFLISSGAATSVCQQSLADSLGGKPRGPVVEARVSHWTSIHYDWQHDDLLAHTRLYQRGGRFSDCAQGYWTAEIYHVSWPSVRQRQRHHVP